MDPTPPADRPPPPPGSASASAQPKKRKKKKKPSAHTGGAEPSATPLTQREKEQLLESLRPATRLPGRLEARKELREREPAKTLAASDEHYKKTLKQGLTLLQSQGKTPEACYLLATSYYGLGKYDFAAKNTTELLEITPHDHYLNASAWLISGRINLCQCKRFNEFNLHCFDKAWQSGHPDAAKYLVLARIGTLNSVSLLKWCNPDEAVRILEQYKDQKKSFEDRLTRSRHRTQTLPDEDAIKQASFQMQSTEGRNMSDAIPFDITVYAAGLCDFMVEGATAEVLGKIERHLSSQDPQSTVSVLYQYLQFLKAASIKARMKHLRAMSKSPQPTARLFCAKAFVMLDPDKYHDDIIAHLNDDYCKMTLQGYDNLCEVFLAKKQIEKAIEQLSEGEEHLKAFLAGTLPLYGHDIGAQAAKSCRSGRPVEEYSALEFEELAAVHKHLEHWQIKKAFLMDTLLPVEEECDDSGQDTDIDILGSSNDVSEDTTTPSDPVDTSTGSTEPSDKKQPPSEISVPEESGAQATAVKAHQNPAYIQRKINKAMNLIHFQAEFDQASTLLSNLNPIKHSVAWYRLQQARAWLKLESATHYDYLSSKLKPGETAASRSKQGLKDVEKKVRSLLHKIETDVSKQLPEPVSIQSSASFSQSIEEAMQYAEYLSKHGEEALLRQYGGLFSLLGHVHKALRDNPLARGQYAVQEGIQYYRIANRIRGRANK